jgi:hypothetical protein
MLHVVRTLGDPPLRLFSLGDRQMLQVMCILAVVCPIIA